MFLMKRFDGEEKGLDGEVQTITEKDFLFFRKVIVTDIVEFSSEKTLVESSVFYNHIEH